MELKILSKILIFMVVILYSVSMWMVSKYPKKQLILMFIVLFALIAKCFVDNNIGHSFEWLIIIQILNLTNVFITLLNIRLLAKQIL